MAILKTGHFPVPDIDMTAPVVLPPASPGASAYAQALEAQFEDPDEPKRKAVPKKLGPAEN